MDALKRVLHAIHLQAKMFYRIELPARWGIQLGVDNGAAFHVVERGRCWLRMADETAPLLLEAGDLVVISNQPYYELSDSPATLTIPLSAFLAGRKILQDQSDATILLCGEFRPENDAVHPLFSLMPPLMTIRGAAGRSVEWLTPWLHFIASESSNARPGSETVISRMMDVLFIMVVRYWIDHHSADDGGWLGALYHPQIGEVLGLMHRQPETDWTVEALAEAVAMARSTLAEQFTAVVGEPPIQYLTRWRMQTAAMLLIEQPGWTVQAVAQRVGYRSSFAFSKAFKRLIGAAPSTYRAKYIAAQVES
jgi:AraC family transcriptional regulator, alkane utilization regulator